jgi:hypothetical protein
MTACARFVMKAMLLLLPASACLWAGPLSYSVTPVPLFQMFGINSQNLVVGESEQGYAAVWNPANNVVTTLPMPAGATNDGGAAYAINSSGQIVGDYYNGTNYQPFFYDPTTGTVNIPNIPLALQGQSLTFNTLNDNGTFVGDIQSPTTLFTGNASGIEILNGPGAWAANGINNAGTIVGAGIQCDPINDANCQFAALIYPNSFIPQFGYGNGNRFFYSDAVAINSKGLILGNAYQGGDDEPDGYVFVYDPDSNSVVYLSQDYFSQYPGTLVNVYNGGLNDSGDIVGQATGGGGVAYGHGASYLLSNLVPANWDILNAYSISNSGGIIGYGLDSDPNNSYEGYVLLEPSGSVPEPSTAFGLLIGLMALAAFRRTLSQTSNPIPATNGHAVPGSGARLKSNEP